MSEENPITDVENGSNTFAIDDDDECVIEDDDDDENYEDEEAHRNAINSILGGGPDAADDCNIHDQLPSVEEVKASNAYLPTALLLAKSHRRKLYLTVAAAAVAAMTLSVFISLGVFSRSSKSNQLGQDAQQNETTKSKLQEIIDKLHHVSNLPRLMDPSSAQYHAAQFLAAGDSLHLDFDGEDGWRTTQRYILAVLYYDSGGKSWTDQFNFMSSEDHCDWNVEFSTPAGRFLKGVQCDDKGSVVDIDLSNNNLVLSKIPAELTVLRDLEQLHLFRNTIGGQLPDMFEFPNLKSLGLFDLDLRGTIPSYFGDMTMLTTLALGKNRFEGSIPESFSKLTDLRILGLDGIGLTGRVDPVLYMSKLEALYLEDNNLSGEIYKNTWHHIQELDLSNNMIDGRIPEEMFENQKLHVFDLNRNLFFGDFPQKFQTNERINYISVHGNSLSGSISDHIGFLPNLKHFDIAGNHFAGTLPDTIQLLTNLVSLSTGGNKFDAKALSEFELTTLDKLVDLSMKGNSLTGTLPENFALMTNLRMLDLDGNALTGTIPTWYGTMGDLAILQLNRNDLSGTIPSELIRLDRLQVLLLDQNNLIGKTTEICGRLKIPHFVTDCYPGAQHEEPEVHCSCCTLCCSDDNPGCNNRVWTANYDPKAMYGYIRQSYDFSLDQTPEGYTEKVKEEAILGGSLPAQHVYAESSF